MSKAFIQNGTGSSATLQQINDEKIPVYDSVSAAEADLANLEENQLVATKSSGADITVVDTVADGNMNAVTSNAVYDYINAAITQVLNTGF